MTWGSDSEKPVLLIYHQYSSRAGKSMNILGLSRRRGKTRTRWHE